MDFIGIMIEAGLILIFLMFWIMSNTDQMQHKRKVILFFLLDLFGNLDRKKKAKYNIHEVNGDEQ